MSVIWKLATINNSICFSLQLDFKSYYVVMFTYRKLYLRLSIKKKKAPT